MPYLSFVVVALKVGAIRDMEMRSAALSSREGAAIARSESLEQELHHQDSKVPCSNKRQEAGKYIPGADCAAVVRLLR